MKRRLRALAIYFGDRRFERGYMSSMISATAATYFWYFSYPTVPAEAGVHAI